MSMKALSKTPPSRTHDTKAAKAGAAADMRDRFVAEICRPE